MTPEQMRAFTDEEAINFIAKKVVFTETWENNYIVGEVQDRVIALARKALSPAPASNGEAVEALKEIASQHTSLELRDLSLVWFNDADFEGGYDACVEKARAALAAINEKEGE